MFGLFLELFDGRLQFFVGHRLDEMRKIVFGRDGASPSQYRNQRMMIELIR